MEKSGIELIAAERQEQFEKHGRTIMKDALENSQRQLVTGAIRLIDTNQSSPNPPHPWDHAIWDKMINKPYVERLAIAGALIAAEIDRIQLTEEIS